MSRTLPSLSGLRAFESAARLGSLAAAAAELGVTAGAVSQQVKGLETSLEVRLFDRGAHSLSLTESGRRYLPVLSGAFDAIAAATAGLGTAAERAVVELTLPALFAAGWLLPRMERFRASHPEVELRLRNSNQLLTPGTEGVDAAIRHGRAGWGNLDCVYLFGDALVAVCAPAYVERRTGLRGAQLPMRDHGRRKRASTSGLSGQAGARAWEALRGATLLEAGAPDGLEGGTPWREWLAWLRSDPGFGTAASKDDAGTLGADRLVLGNEGLALQAALNGLGLALVDQHLVEAPLREGRLVLPFDVPPWRRGTAWYLVHAPTLGVRHGPELSPGNAGDALTVLREWLLAEAEGPIL